MLSLQYNELPKYKTLLKRNSRFTRQEVFLPNREVHNIF